MSAPLPVLAHAGHWTASLVYVVPVVSVVAFLVIQQQRDKRSGYVEPLDEEHDDDFSDLAPKQR